MLSHLHLQIFHDFFYLTEENGDKKSQLYKQK